MLTSQSSRKVILPLFFLLSILIISGVVFTADHQGPEDVAALVLEQITGERASPPPGGDDTLASLNDYYARRYRPYFTEVGLEAALAQRVFTRFAPLDGGAGLSSLAWQRTDIGEDRVSLYASFRLEPVAEDSPLRSPLGWHANLVLNLDRGQWYVSYIDLGKNTAPIPGA